MQGRPSLKNTGNHAKANVSTSTLRVGCECACTIRRTFSAVSRLKVTSPHRSHTSVGTCSTKHSVSAYAEEFIRVFLVKDGISTNLAFFHLCVLRLCEGSFFLFPGKRGYREPRSWSSLFSRVSACQQSHNIISNPWLGDHFEQTSDA